MNLAVRLSTLFKLLTDAIGAPPLLKRDPELELDRPRSVGGSRVTKTQELRVVQVFAHPAVPQILDV